MPKPITTTISTSIRSINAFSIFSLWPRDDRSGDLGLRKHCRIFSSEPYFIARELRGNYNQPRQQYRSDNRISPKIAPNCFLICRIELLIFVDDLSAHRIPLPRRPIGLRDYGAGIGEDV